MSRNTVLLRATPEDVFSVLVDAYSYGHWVVGARKVVSESPHWPDVGSSFVHEQGAGPFHVRDTTTVMDIDPPRRLSLRAKVRQVGFETDLEFTLHPKDDGTELVMWEEPVGLWGKLWNPVLDRLMWARNVVGLERLQTLIEPLAKGSGSETPPAVTEKSGPPAILGAAAALGFWGAATVRGKRAFHPTGELYEAELEIASDPSLPTTAFLREHGRHRAIVRLSRGAGLPAPFPDFPGLAIKLPDRWGPGADQDFLLVSSGAGMFGRRILWPTGSKIAPRYSSITSYVVDRSRVWFGAEPTAPERFAFQASFEAGDHKAVGSLMLGDRIDEQNAEFHFDVWNTHPELVPSGLVNALRKPAYAGSREGRGT